MTPICSSSHGPDSIIGFCCLNNCIFIGEEKSLSSPRFTDVSNPTKMKQFVQRMSSKQQFLLSQMRIFIQLLLLRNHGFYLFASFPVPESWLWCSFSKRASLMAVL